MRAALLRNVGDDALEVRDDIGLVDVGPGEVKVKIEATGVCHSDLSVMTGTIPQPAPCILGHEGAGIVAEIGEGVTDVKVGDHVIIAWSPPWGECAYCGPRHQPNLWFNLPMVRGGAAHFSLDGMPVSGMAVPAPSPRR
jgi:S-(hydroxymethyl)glutathione dehydrogenase/alcohol dehydrogenase